MGEAASITALAAPAIELHAGINNISDLTVQNSAKALYKNMVPDRFLIRNRVVDDFVKMLVYGNNGVIDVKKFKDDKAKDERATGVKKNEVGQADLADFEDRANRNVRALIAKGVEPEVFDPIREYINSTKDDIQQLFS